MINIAVIGVGKWGQNHARVYKELACEGIIIGRLKICDADANRLKQLKAALNADWIEWSSSYHDIAKDKYIDAVNIATPSKTHYPIAKELIEAGKDVLIEKPMTMNVNEAKELVALADNHKRILMVGHLMRYHPAVQKLKQMIDTGDLGKIHTLIGTRMDFGLPRRDMGVIYALGVHELDLFCYLLEVDSPRSIVAATNKTYSQEIEETAMIYADFGYAKGYALESWLVSAYGKRRDLVVVGTKSSTRIDYLSTQPLQIFDSTIITEGGVPISAQTKGNKTVALPYDEPLREELRHFISCVKSRQKPLSDGHVGWQAVVMADAALESAEKGKLIKLKEAHTL